MRMFRIIDNKVIMGAIISLKVHFFFLYVTLMCVHDSVFIFIYF
jgi:hypothetical protein